MGAKKEKYIDEEFEIISADCNLKFLYPENNNLAKKKRNLRFDLVKDNSDEDAIEKPKKTAIEYKKRNIISGFYFKAENHFEYYNFGDSYLRDYKDSKRIFAFEGEGNLHDIQKTIFGLASYFAYHAEKHVIILTSDVKKSYYYEQLKEHLDVVPKDVLSFEYIDCYEMDGLTIINIPDFKNIVSENHKSVFDDIMKRLMRNDPVVFCEIPGLVTLETEQELYYPLIKMVDSVSFVVKYNKNKNKHLIGMKDYFLKYGVTIKGVICQ